MSAKRYTVDNLVTSVKARASVPESDGTITSEDLIRFANEDLDENIIPLILSTREEYYLTYEDYNVENGQQEYDIPYRAIGMRIRAIKTVVDGKEGRVLSHIPLELVDNNDGIQDYDIDRGFYLRNDKIVFITPLYSGGSGGSFRVYFYLRPNDLVLTSRVGTIESIDTSTNTLTVTSFPSVINDNSEVDFIQSTPNHRTYSYDIQVSSVSAATRQITVASLPSSLQVGDYICLAGETPTPQMPVDIIPVLEQAVVCKVLESIGDTVGLKNATSRLEKLEKRLMSVLDSRVESPGRKAVNPNSLLAGRKKSRYGSI